MFTGIVTELGQIKQLQSMGSTARMWIAAPKTCADAQTGDSICVNGVCLTAETIDGDVFQAGLSSETLARTTFETQGAGTNVNIEPALRPQDRLGGHIVAGHVDGVGQIVSLNAEGEFWNLVFSFPESLAPYMAEKGSVAIDGISLTLTFVRDSQAGVAVVPFTYEQTILHTRTAGDAIHLEADVIARYVERMLHYGKAKPGLTMETLKQYGYSV